MTAGTVKIRNVGPFGVTVRRSDLRHGPLEIFPVTYRDIQQAIQLANDLIQRPGVREVFVENTDGFVIYLTGMFGNVFVSEYRGE